MNHALYHLENYLIPGLQKIVDNYLLAHPNHADFFYARRFKTEELLKYLAEHFDPQIKRENYNQKILLEQIFAYLTEKGIYHEQS